MLKLRNLNPLTAITLVAALTLSAAQSQAAPPAVPDIVKQIPADATIFVAVKNLDELSKDVAAFNKDLGINAPPAANLLGMIKQQLRIEKGINNNAGAAVVLRQLPEGFNPPAPLLILPVSDFKAFMGNWNLAPVAGINTIQVEDSDVFIQQHGKYIVASTIQEEVKNYKPNPNVDYQKRVGNLASHVLGKSDIVVYVNLEKVVKAVKPMFALGMEEFEKEFAQFVPKQHHAMAKAGLNIFKSAANAVLDGSQAFLMGIDVSNAGLGFSFSAQFKDGSTLAKAFNAPPKNPVSFNKLPNKPYLVASSIDSSSTPINQWLTDASNALPKDDPAAAMIKTALNSAIKSGNQTQTAIYPPHPRGIPALFNSVTVFNTKNPDETIQSLEDSIHLAGKLAPDESEFKILTLYKKDALKEFGRRVDHYSVRFKVPAEAQKTLGNMGPLVFLQDYGGFITKSNKSVIMTSAADPIFLKEAVNAVEKGSKLDNSAQITEMRKNLLPHRMMELYISPATLLGHVKNFAVLAAPEVADINIPRDMPPMALSMSAYKGGVTTQFFVSKKMMLQIKKIVEDAMSLGIELP